MVIFSFIFYFCIGKRTAKRLSNRANSIMLPISDKARHRTDAYERKTCKNLKIPIRHINTLSVAAAVAFFFVYTYASGYGAGHVADSAVGSGLQQVPPSTLDVIYERTDCGRSDFLHLHVDTVYNSRGKGFFHMRPSCSRKMALRRFDGEYCPADIDPQACFVANASTSSPWHDTGATRRIMGYECRCAEASLNGRTWHVWYTDLLPHCTAGAVPTDDMKGLILEACTTQEGGYSLKARYIAQKTG